MTVSAGIPPTKHGQDSLIEPTLNSFPPLPQGYYKHDPSSREHITIDLPGVSDSQITSVPKQLMPVAWALVLASHTNSPDALFGIAFRGRCTATGEQAILPCCLRIRPDETATDAIANATQYDDAMRQFQHLGLQKFSSLSPENVAVCQFRNLLILGDYRGRFDGGDSEIYPLTLHATGRHVSASFNSRVLSPDTVHMMLVQLADIVQMAIERPSATMRDLQNVGMRGLALIRGWNTPRHQMSDDETTRVQDLLEKQCASRPCAPAVDAWDGSLTYGELDRWASSTARRLVTDAMVRPGAFVGLFMKKSVKAVVAMLGVMRTGAGFLFMPPDLPQERLRAMCRIANVQCVVTAPGGNHAATTLGVPVFEIQEAESQLPKDTGVGKKVLGTDTDPIYATFTSGSTGEPKGIVVDRASFGPGIAYMCALTGLSPDSRVFHAVSHAFVVGVTEQLITLAMGACLCVPSEEQLENEMEATMVRFKATWAILTPSVARLLTPTKIIDLKTLLLAGEPVTAADVAQWSAGSTTLYSFWGQSEAASTYLLQRLSTNPYLETGSLGLPTTGKCWVVNAQDHHRLSPLGVEGELLLESAALARGYLGDVAPTAATFVEEPLWHRKPECRQEASPSTSRWLLTGDIVRYNKMDGSLQLIGRKGTRTKIRGQRVELGEIESQLRKQMPGALQVVSELVMPAPRQGDEKGRQPPPMLVAFTCRNQKVPPTGLEITTELTKGFRPLARQALSALRQVLPAYMVPSAILPMRFLPRTVTGKINRRSLRDWAAQKTVDEILGFNEERVPFRLPENEAERVVQEACEEVLQLPRSSAGLDDNFLRLGGDSLTAQRLATVATARGLRITASDVLKQSTLAEMAASGGPCSSQPSSQEDEPKTDGEFEALKQNVLQALPQGIDPQDVEDVYPTLEMQSLVVDLVIIDYFPFEIDGPVDVNRLRHACQIFVDFQPAFRSIFFPFQGHTVQVVLRTLEILWEELTLPAGADLMMWTRSWAMNDRARVPALSKPALSFTFIHGEDQHSAFVLKLPHAQYDGVCMQEIVQQLGTMYHNPHLATPPKVNFTSYRRACARLRTPRALQFWRDLLADAEVSRLPRLSPGDETVSIYSGECEPATPPTGITMATAIKAAWAYVVAQETNKTDVLFGQITNCRGILPAGGQEIVGMCLNTTPVRAHITPTLSVKDLLATIQQQHVQALEYQTIDWFDMVAESTPWAPDTDLDSAVLHENFANAGNLSLGEATGRMANPFFTTPGWKRHLLVTWPGEQKLTTFLMVRQGAFDTVYAEGLVARFNETLTRFLNFPERSLSGLQHIDREL